MLGRSEPNLLSLIDFTSNTKDVLVIDLSLWENVRSFSEIQEQFLGFKDATNCVFMFVRMCLCFIGEDVTPTTTALHVARHALGRREKFWFRFLCFSRQRRNRQGQLVVHKKTPSFQSN